jgi:NAD(P)-dependent dehydrogenase (short-subunit alcohol dehydrogenase family)
MRLHGKVAIATGSASGIGHASAVRFAQKGAAVVVDYVGNPEVPSKTEKKITRIGGKAIAAAAGASGPDEVQNLTDRTIAAFGRHSFNHPTKSASKGTAIDPQTLSRIHFAHCAYV